LLAERGFATDIIWIFAENLCVEKSRAEPGGFHFGFQTRFTPRLLMRWTSRSTILAKRTRRLSFYRLGGRPGKSVCMLLCDSWFETGALTTGFCAATNGGFIYPARRMKSRKSPT